MFNEFEERLKNKDSGLRKEDFELRKNIEWE